VSESKEKALKASRNLSRGVMYAARWIMAPIYLGLLTASTSDTILVVLTLVDLSLVANLVVIVMVAGWENFVGRLLDKSDGSQLEWVGDLDFGAVKMKLIASVTAIAAIQMLETFVHIDQTSKQDAMWQLFILLGIGVTGVLLALMDKLSGEH
jgi:uncharacterized protein (TIGR00645 family)